MLWRAGLQACALLACSLLQSCTALREPKLAEGPVRDVEIKFSRTPCFGACPVYSIAIAGNGAVSYLGEGHVAVKGPASGRLSPDQVRRLLKALDEARFFSLQNEYTHIQITDAPGTVIEVISKARSKKVIHNQGDLSAPPALERLEDAIDEIVGSQKWVK
ncbi:MAG: hypothetical protein HY921_11850 [Elusimicrobia bacterium]|nr:hypothetical protein [Elusimicrobiota bacterium]